MQTPDSIIAELVAIRQEVAKGADALYDAECKLADRELVANTTEAKAFLEADGKNVAERQAQAALLSAEAKLDLDLARAEFNRIRTKLRILEQSQMSVQTQARLVEMTYKG